MARLPEDNGVISLIAGPVRAVPLEVRHTPNVDLQDRSHVDIVGKKDAEVRLKLLDVFAWEIRIRA